MIWQELKEIQTGLKHRYYSSSVVNGEDIEAIYSSLNVKICPRMNFHFSSLVDDDGSKFSEKGFLGILHQIINGEPEIT